MIPPRTIRVLAGATLFVAVAGCASLVRSRSATSVTPLPPPLADYPARESLGRVGGWHVRNLEKGGPQLLALISWSTSGGTRSWSGMMVGPLGGIGDFRDIWSYALQGSGDAFRPGPHKPAHTLALLEGLGPSVSPPPPIDRVLLVSWLRKGRWTTRRYDRANPPAALVALERELNDRKPGDDRTVWRLGAGR